MTRSRRRKRIREEERAAAKGCKEKLVFFCCGAELRVGLLGWLSGGEGEDWGKRESGVCV